MVNKLKHIVLLSGGHSSARVAVEVVRKYGVKNTILLNHDINSKYEDRDIKRFKQEISDFLGIPITYANAFGQEDPTKIPSQFDVCIKAGALTDPNSQGALCTAFLKTIPFENFLNKNFYPYPTLFEPLNPCIIYYGFDKKEKRRIQRRSSIMASKGYKICCPLAQWETTITSTEEIGILPPLTYAVYEHANCIGCLKASLLHWYVVSVFHPMIYTEAMEMEQELDFTIHTVIREGIKKSISLEELLPIFRLMKEDGLLPTEHQSKIKFANQIRKYQLQEVEVAKPCECLI